MADPVVTFSKSDSLGYIILDRPPANSYEIGFMHDLDAAIQAAEAEAEVQVVIFRSASEKFFSAGADIKAFKASSTADNMEMVRTAHAALDKMAASSKVFGDGIGLRPALRSRRLLSDGPSRGHARAAPWQRWDPAAATFDWRQ
jgi:hypothetical protein